jgi:hypothetical protein
MRAWKVIWPPLAVVALHAMVAAVFGHRLALDPAFHVFGGVAGAYCVSEGLLQFPRLFPVRTTVNRQLVAVSVVCAVALLWEFAEFTSDTLFGTLIQLGSRDTLTDLALGAAGASVCALMMFWRERSRRPQHR